MLQSCERLRPVTDATSVQVRNGKTAVLSGPYADTHEQLGGFYVIDASDLDAALQWAARVHLQQRKGAVDAANAAYAQAIGLELAPAVKLYLQQQRENLRHPTPSSNSHAS